MLILDIDDTLVPRGGGISQKNAAAIQKAREAGVYVTLATGRGYYGSSHVFRELGLDTYVINYAGAVINDTRTDKPIFVTELDNDFVQEILAMADDMNLHAHLYQGDRIVYEREHPYASAYCAALNLPYSIDSDIRKKTWQNVPKVLIITEPERVSELLPFFKKSIFGKQSGSLGVVPRVYRIQQTGCKQGYSRRAARISAWIRPR